MNVPIIAYFNFYQFEKYLEECGFGCFSPIVIDAKLVTNESMDDENGYPKSDFVWFVFGDLFTMVLSLEELEKVLVTLKKEVIQ